LLACAQSAAAAAVEEDEVESELVLLLLLPDPASVAGVAGVELVDGLVVELLELEAAAPSELLRESVL
jgi:hypothetical protein